MFDMTSENIQAIAVTCVTKFMTKQASLNEAIAHEAAELELNPEQIKRVIEASNTIAYLRQLKDSEDRTFEFPVAEYPGVMKSMVIPADSQNSTTQVIIKKASAVGKSEADITDRMSSQEKSAILSKEYFKTSEWLAKSAELKADIFNRLMDSVDDLKRDELALEKLAEVVPEDYFHKVAHMCGLKISGDGLTKLSCVFRTNELDVARRPYLLLKEAEQLQVDIDRAEAFVKRASDILTKQGSLAWGAGRLIGTGLAGAAKYVTKKVIPQAKATGKAIGFEGAASGAAGILSANHAQGVWESLH